jgi:hypothetical protein
LLDDALDKPTPRPDGIGIPDGFPHIALRLSAQNESWLDP